MGKKAGTEVSLLKVSKLLVPIKYRKVFFFAFFSLVLIKYRKVIPPTPLFTDCVRFLKKYLAWNLFDDSYLLQSIRSLCLYHMCTWYMGYLM